MTTESTIAIEREVRIAARPEIVFRLLTDAREMLKWQGIDAELDARPGGVYRLVVNRLGHTALGRFVEVVPHSRIVFTWGWEPQFLPIPPGSTTVEITLRADGDGTVLHLQHSGLPNLPAVAAAHGAGWDHAFERLAMFAEGRPLPEDPWMDGLMEGGGA